MNNLNTAALAGAALYLMTGCAGIPDFSTSEERCERYTTAYALSEVFETGTEEQRNTAAAVLSIACAK